MTKGQIAHLVFTLTKVSDSLPAGSGRRAMLIDAAVAIRLQRDTLEETERRLRALEIQLEMLLHDQAAATTLAADAFS